jgi:hypothetical protein
MSIFLTILLILAGLIYTAIGFFLYVFAATSSEQWGKNNSFVNLLYMGAVNKLLSIPTFLIFTAGWPLWLGLILLFEKKA